MVEKGGSSPLSIKMLGGFSLRVGINTLELEHAPKLQGVLAYLILHRNRTISKQELIAQFWADEWGANPDSAIKTTIHRLRQQLAPLFPDGGIPLSSVRGAYRWETNIECRVDVESFEALCEEAAKPGMPASTCILLYQQALPLYEGDLLPALSGQEWLSSLTTHYHALYIHAVKACADLLLPRGAYHEVRNTCRLACQLEPLDEALHIRIIRAMIGENDLVAALQYYDTVAALLYKNLRTRPTDAFQQLHSEILSCSEREANTLDAAIDEIGEILRRTGAYMCPYPYFQECCRMEVYRPPREGRQLILCMLSVRLPGGRTPTPSDMLSTLMDTLQKVLLYQLRRGDVVARYSHSQFIIMLPDVASLEQASGIMQRIIKNCEIKNGIFQIYSEERVLEPFVQQGMEEESPTVGSS